MAECILIMYHTFAFNSECKKKEDAMFKVVFIVFLIFLSGCSRPMTAEERRLKQMNDAISEAYDEQYDLGSGFVLKNAMVINARKPSEKYFELYQDGETWKYRPVKDCWVDNLIIYKANSKVILSQARKHSLMEIKEVIVKSGLRDEFIKEVSDIEKCNQTLDHNFKKYLDTPVITEVTNETGFPIDPFFEVIKSRNKPSCPFDEFEYVVKTKQSNIVWSGQNQSSNVEEVLSSKQIILPIKIVGVIPPDKMSDVGEVVNDGTLRFDIIEMKNLSKPDVVATITIHNNSESFVHIKHVTLGINGRLSTKETSISVPPHSTNEPVSMKFSGANKVTELWEKPFQSKEAAIKNLEISIMSEYKKGESMKTASGTKTISLASLIESSI